MKQAPSTFAVIPNVQWIFCLLLLAIDFLIANNCNACYINSSVADPWYFGKCFAFTLWRYIFIILYGLKVIKKVTKQQKPRFFLLYLLDDVRIQIRIQIRIPEAKKIIRIPRIPNTALDHDSLSTVLPENPDIWIFYQTLTVCYTRSLTVSTLPMELLP